MGPGEQRAWAAPYTAAVVGLALAGPAAAATITVCPDGSCDHERITACAAAAPATGDVCLVGPGVYRETVDYSGNFTTGVRIVCETPGTCVVDGDGVREHGFFLYRDWEIDGFEIRHTTGDAISTTSSRFLAAVRNSWIHDAGGRGISNIGASGVVEGNVVERVWGAGIFCNAAATVRNNVVVDPGLGGAYGIQCTYAGSVVEHNTVDVRRQTPPAASTAAYGILSETVRYNIVLGGATSIRATGSSTYNTVWGASSTDVSPAPGTGDAVAEPSFLGERDLHLAAPLPATGSTLLFDLDGDPHGLPPDQGAYAFDPSDLPPVETWVDEVVADVSSPAPLDLVHLPRRGPAVLFLDPDADALTYAVRTLDTGTGRHAWATQTVWEGLPPSALSLDPWRRPIAAAVHPTSGRPVVAWLEGVGSTSNLRFARQVGGGCGSGCATADWDGCDDLPLLTFVDPGHVATAFDPVDGSVWVAVVGESGASCGADRDLTVDVFHDDGSGWTAIPVAEGGCTDALGFGLDLSVDPVTGAAEVAYTRTVLGGTSGTLEVATVPRGGSTTVTSVPLGSLATWSDVHTLVALAHDTAGDLHVAFSASDPAWSYAQVHRTDGVWGDATVFDAVGMAGIRPNDGLDVEVDVADRAWVLHSLSETLREGELTPPTADWAQVDVRRNTGWYAALAFDDFAHRVRAYQEALPAWAVRVAADHDPGADVPGARFDQTCGGDGSDPCAVGSCDDALGCVESVTVCDDEDPCTDDTCLPGGGCDVAFNTAPCDDGDLDTIRDTCAMGVCAGIPLYVSLREVQEPIAVADTLTLRTGQFVARDEGIGVADEVALTPGARIRFTERIGVTDEVGLYPSRSIVVDEGIVVDDAVALFPPVVMGTVVEGIGVADVVGVTADALPGDTDTGTVDTDGPGDSGEPDDTDEPEVPTSCGGCSTGPGGVGGGPLLVLMAAVAWGRRRRA